MNEAPLKSGPSLRKSNSKANWLNTLSTSLTEEGLPAEHVQRCLEEFGHHIDDLADSAQSCDVMGSPCEITSGLVSAYRRATPMRRLPAWAWLIAPLPLAILVTLAYYVAAGICIELHTTAFENHPVAKTDRDWITWYFWLGKFAAPLISTYLVLWLMRGLGRPPWVHRGAILSLATAHALLFSELAFPSGGVELSLNLAIDHPPTVNNLLCQTMEAALVIIVAIKFGTQPRSSSS